MANRPKNAMTLKTDGLAIPSNTESLVADLRRMIDETRSAVAVAVNVSLTFLYWRVGQRIRQEVDTVFGVTGGCIVNVVDSFHKAGL